ncbi:MAG: glycosyltransferase family 39 protein [bacterium]|nr:glycosyltransferase family 39 protein [bacterium]
MRKIHIVLLLLILGIAVFLRVFNLQDIPPGVYPDVAMNGNNALYTLDTGTPEVFYPENNGREGLFIVLLAWLMSIFGQDIWVLRLPSALFGILTVFGTYLLTKELFRETHKDKAEVIALLAAFFIATSFWHINFSRIGFRAIMAPFFLTFGFYFLWLTLRKDISATKRILAATLGGVFFGGGFYSYIAYRVMPLLLIIPAVRMWQIQGFKNIGKKGCIWCSFALFLFFSFVAVVPLGMYFLEHPADFLGRTAQISVFDTPSPLKTLTTNTIQTLGMFWFSGDTNWRHNFSGAPQLWFPVGILFALGILVHVSSLRKKKYWHTSLFLLGWIALGLLPVIFSNEGIPHALRALLVIPPVMILAAHAFSSIIHGTADWLATKEHYAPQSKKQLKRIQKELLVLLFVFLVAGASQAYNQYFIRWAYHPETYNASSGNYTGLGIWLAQQPNEIKKYIIINAGGTPVHIPGSTESIPMPSQTIMFLTDSWSADKQKEKNIVYLLPEKIELLTCSDHCIVAMLERDEMLRFRIREHIPELHLSPETGYLILQK